MNTRQDQEKRSLAASDPDHPPPTDADDEPQRCRSRWRGQGMLAAVIGTNRKDVFGRGESKPGSCGRRVSNSDGGGPATSCSSYRS